MAVQGSDSVLDLTDLDGPDDLDGLDLVAISRRAVHSVLKGAMPRSTDGFNDLMSDAQLGAVRAQLTFDPTRSMSRGAYTWHKARYAVIDGLRQRNPVSRWQRAQGQTLDTLPAQYQPPLALTHDGDDDENGESHGVDVADPTALLGFQQIEARLTLMRLMEGLNEREQLAIVLHHFEGMSQQDIAEQFGVTASRVSQIMSASYRKMRRLHEAEPIDTEPTAAVAALARRRLG